MTQCLEWRGGSGRGGASWVWQLGAESGGEGGTWGYPGVSRAGSADVSRAEAGALLSGYPRPWGAPKGPGESEGRLILSETVLPLALHT